MRHARQSAWRMDERTRQDCHGRRGCPRNALAQQEILPVETVAGVFRLLQPARTDRLRDPARVNGSNGACSWRRGGLCFVLLRKPLNIPTQGGEYVYGS